jgi:adenine-specific DNA-methyltransferase
MPTLHWIGKEKVINHHLDVPYKVLEHTYHFNNEIQTLHSPTESSVQETIDDSSNKITPGHPSPNKIIHGDNLEALKSLLPEYEGKIKCIYIDPPYNTGNEGWVYNDNVTDPKIKKWLGQVVGKESEDLSRHDKWLCMMYPRLKLLHKLLADDGAIFISIDDIEVNNLRLVLNEIFGNNAFISQLVWKSRQSEDARAKTGVSNDHEYVIC